MGTNMQPLLKKSTSKTYYSFTQSTDVSQLADVLQQIDSLTDDETIVDSETEVSTVSEVSIQSLLPYEKRNYDRHIETHRSFCGVSSSNENKIPNYNREIDMTSNLLEPTTNLETISERNAAGGSSPIPDPVKSKPPNKLKVKSKTKKGDEFSFFRRMVKSKRQLALMEQYKLMSNVLKQLSKGQTPSPLNNKHDRKRRHHLVKKIHKLFHKLRSKLKKRDLLQRQLLMKRVQQDRQKKVQKRLRKILNVVYTKRQQRIRNMRQLRVRERKRASDSLMLKAAKLRARANRLTGGHQLNYKLNSKLFQNLAQNSKKEKIKKIKASVVKKEEIPQVSTTETNQNETVKVKRHTRKRKRKIKQDKCQRKQKRLDEKIKNLNERMKKLLGRLSIYSEKKIKHNLAKDQSYQRKSTHKITRISGGQAYIEGKKREKRKRKHKIYIPRIFRPAWWRRGRLKSAIKRFRTPIKPKTKELSEKQPLNNTKKEIKLEKPKIQRTDNQNLDSASEYSAITAILCK